MPYIYGEAFCLMKYRASGANVEEVLWNSRDGVTPFVIRSRDRKHELTHVDWAKDERNPNHVPQPGDRIFVSITREIAETHAKQIVERDWNDPQYPMSDLGTKEEAVEALVTQFMSEPGAPTVVEVVDWAKREFKVSD